MIQHACPKCGTLTDQHYCPRHRDKPWERSTRRSRSGWAQQRRARYVINRDKGICHVCRQPDADQADHVIPLSAGGEDHTDNMAPIHGGPDSCHSRKTAAEAAKARGRLSTY